ncbi:hypothetical protein BFJ63_vAg100 [Fusarium oxysporum f. sp. narcissi]|uniref:Uncharacterized protein n=1 Tax=Fusarium oxysporum f. sp. narcissi TaxID=451672 RepID=A0A4Q2WBN8_FUSOX|nr:hypothetical protein NW765_000264 [Fusarium oxysporum]KAJ4278289.1 hypothetical protein NW764_007097 [Fusarium oxysporum]RYC96934.1 hypothetical protein BFJ63_vAg100 [Fusarium oxysporum f. sp. narcissi]
MAELPEDSKSPIPSSVFDSDADDTNFMSPVLLPLTVSIDDDDAGQLSAPQTNTPAELSEPRQIISSGDSSELLQAELRRPVLAGTYFNEPAYLVQLRLHLSLSSGNRSWLSRIQTVDIHVLVEDAPRDDGQNVSDDSEDSDDDYEEEEFPHPAIVKAFPGPSGWEGSPQSAEVTITNGIGMQVGYNPASISYNIGESRTRTKTGAIKVKVAHKGPGQNKLHVRVEESSVDKAGVPDYLLVPFIIRHRSRRFRMRVGIHARFGFWRGKLAEVVPILGRADEPLFFDPRVMRQAMEKGRRGVNGEKVIEWHGALDEVALQEYSSLVDASATQAQGVEGTASG